MKKNDMKIEKLYSLEHTMAKELLEKYEYPWEALPYIGEFIRELGEKLPKKEYDSPRDGMWIHKTAKIAPTAGIIGPVIIGPTAEIRHCAYIRGKVIIGAGAVVGYLSSLSTSCS